MPSAAEKQVLRDFVKRNCAVTVTPDGKEERGDGYFRFDVGRTSRESRKAAAMVEWGDPELAAEECWKRVSMLISEGAPKVWVRSIGSGDSHAIDSVCIDGEPESSLEVTTDPKGAHAVNEAVAAVMLGQHRMIASLVERNERVAEERQEAILQAGLYMLAAQGAQDGGRMAAMQASLVAIGPTLERTIPMLVSAWLGAPLPSGPAVPDGADPGAALDAAIVEVDAVFRRMANIAVAHPGTMNAERIARITGVLAKYGGGPSPQPAENGPPTPTEPEPEPEPESA